MCSEDLQILELNKNLRITGFVHLVAKQNSIAHSQFPVFITVSRYARLRSISDITPVKKITKTGFQVVAHSTINLPISISQFPKNSKKNISKLYF